MISSTTAAQQQSFANRINQLAAIFPMCHVWCGVEREIFSQVRAMNGCCIQYFPV